MASSKKIPSKSKETKSVKKSVAAKPFLIEKKALLKPKIEKSERSIEQNPKIETAEGWKRKAFKARDDKKK